MRRLPFPDGRFDTLVCADNSLPHLLTEQEVHAALAEMRRVLRPEGLLLVSTRHYDELLPDRPASTPPQIHRNVECVEGEERTVTFQLWHDDGEHYDLEHFQLLPAGGEWRVNVRRTTYWALGQTMMAVLRLGWVLSGRGWADRIGSDHRRKPKSRPPISPLPPKIS